MLEVLALDAFYGDVQALWEVSFTVGEGEIVTLVGANGAGKSTALKCVSGLLRPRRGRILLGGADVSGRPPYELVREGVVLIPEARQLWPGMTVLENLEVGAFGPRARAHREATLETVLALFPVLGRRASQKAGTLSGGEQQMCAIGRGLMARPNLLLLDEPALGLAPRLVTDVFAALRAINGRGVTLLLVEQNVPHALALSHRAYVLESGRITLSGPSAELARDPRVRQEFLGLASI